MTPREQARRSRQIIGQDFPPFLETIRDMDLSAEDKAMIFESFLELLEPLARSGHDYLLRCKKGNAGSVQARRKAPHVKLIEDKARLILSYGDERHGLASRIKEECRLGISTRQINYILARAGI